MMARSRRSARQAARNLRYSNVTNNNNKRVSTVEQPKSALEQLIQDNDTMLYGEVDYMIQSKYRWSNTAVRNDIFNGYDQKIKAEKIGIIWSPKKKLYLLLAINDDYSCYILFRSQKLDDLPFNKENQNYQLINDSNRKMIGILRYEPIWDLTINPIMSYKPSELFRR